MTTKNELVPIEQELSGILLINKSVNTPSFNLIRSLRKATGIRKIGHAGTLDPFATGILAIALGEATKSIRYLNQSKVYKICMLAYFILYIYI